MIVEIEIEDGLELNVQRQVNRQINFKFASAGAHVRVLSVSIGTTEDHGEFLYACQMDASLHNGGRKTAHTEGKHPNMCITDAAARLARSICRDQVLSDARQAMR